MTLVIEGKEGGEGGGSKGCLGEIANAWSMEVVGIECGWCVGGEVDWRTPTEWGIMGELVGIGLGLAGGRKDGGRWRGDLGRTGMKGGNWGGSCLIVGRLGQNRWL